jgi:hypothetical protein
MVRQLRQLKRGKLNYADFGHQAVFSLTTNLSVSYLGYATKNAQYPATSDSAAPARTTAAP